MDKESFDPNRKPESLYPDRETDSFRQVKKDCYGEGKRSVAKLKEILENQEQRKVKKDILDESGKKLCTIELDSSDGKLISVSCEPYINVEVSAEHPDEKIYITDESGQITQEHLTRGEAREQKKRYLIVTSLIFHGDDMLIQKRSPEKKIDPDKLSTSAHGVAKEVFSEDQVRIEDSQMVALINTAMEINEELRHGEAPFKIRIWPGTHDELYDYAKEEKINDSNTIFLVPESYLPDDGYPLGSWREKRTRAISAGFIFSENRPSLSIDSSELQECKWQTMSSIFKEPETTKDLPSTSMEVLIRILRDSPLARRYGIRVFENMLRRLQGLEPYEKP